MTAFFKRFAVKFIEVVGAGIATALSGYLLAHFSGYWSSTASAPPAVQVAPSTSVVDQKFSAPTRSPLTPRTRSSVASGASDQSGVDPAGADHCECQGHGGFAQASAGRNHAVESKQHDEESVEAQVRAALANVDASRPAPAEASPREVDVSPVVPAVAAQPKPADGTPPVTAVAAVPPAAETLPPPPPAQIAPAEPEPLTPVEIKSRPVPPLLRRRRPVAPVLLAAKEDDQDLLSMIKKIPDLLRPNAPPPEGEAPRPPVTGWPDLRWTEFCEAEEFDP